MADEIGVSLLRNDNFQGSGVAECLVDLSRKTQEYGPARVDNPESISIDLAAEVSMKAFLLKTFFAPPGVPLAKPSQGQVGFLPQILIGLRFLGIGLCKRDLQSMRPLNIRFRFQVEQVEPHRSMAAVQRISMQIHPQLLQLTLMPIIVLRDGM